MSKAKVLPIRFNERENSAIEKAAKADHLPVSTWIKQLVMKHIDSQEADNKMDDSAPIR